MNRESIKQKLVTLCAELFQNSEAGTDYLECVDFAEDLGMDSITFITLIVEIEEIFNITIPDDLLLMDNFKNINDVVRVIADLIENK